MNDIVKTYQERFRRNRHNFRRYAALLLALAMITTLFVNWQLHGVGISMTADYQCGEIEHTHTADCYEKVLICPYTEGEPEDGTVVSEPVAEEPAADTGIAVYNAEPEYIFVPHEHTDDCYTEVKSLTCSEEEHIHNDDCFDPEDGSLICDKFEHTHDEDCYTTERELTCGLEEGELVEELNPDYTPVATFEAPVAQTPVVVEPVAETPVHHHTDACYEEVLVCPLPEHQHTVNCLSDQTADIEDEGEWLAATDTTLGSSWAENLLAVAQSQLGYEQSEKNFKLETDEYNDDVVRHYTRYGQWYGNPYGEWDMMFLSYCLHYAEIPQSVVPQTAGVLALRSAMNNNGTALLQDVDSRTVAVQDADSADAGTTIAPGDIVIYSKNKMETVVWEQSEPTTDPSDSGIALYSSGFVPSGPVVADDDFVAPTDPTPVYTTKTTTVETAGIVESVDSKRGIVTVISGDVEGKVDTLELSLAQVQSVISMTRAQDITEGTTTQGAKVLNDSHITSTIITINGTPYTVKGDSTYPSLPEGVSVTVDDTVKLEYHFDIPEAELEGTTTNTLTYQLPEGLIALKQGTKGPLTNEAGQTIGEITVSDTGLATLRFNKNLTGQTSGKFTIECRVTESSTSTDSKITFPGCTNTIDIKKQTDLTVSKKVDAVDDLKINKTADGKYKIHYVVTAKSTHGSGKDIDLSDAVSWISDSSMFSNIQYTNIKLYKSGTKAEYADCKFEQAKGSNGYPCLKVTTQDGKPLPELGAGESYRLEYDLEVDKLKQGYGKIDNTAWANNEKGGANIEFQDELDKNGSYDPVAKTITWTIDIYPNGNKLSGFVLEDTLPPGTTMTGKFSIKDNGNNELVTRDNFEIGKNSFSYTFPNKAPFNTSSSYKYTVTYTTTAPDGFAVGDSVENTATIKLDKDGNKSWTDSGDATYNDRNKTIEKKATGNTTLNSSDMDENGLFTLPWKLKVELPQNGWNSHGVLEIKDTIKRPENGDHYAIKSDLQSAIEKDLSVVVDGQPYTYGSLPAGLNLTIQYFGEENYQDRLSDPVDDDAIIRSFKLHFTKDETFTGTLGSVTINSYETKASYDKDALKEGQTIIFENASENVSGKYKFTVPASDTKDLVKMSSNTPGSTETQQTNDCINQPPYDYKAGNDVKVTYGNGYKDFDGKESDGTYIYYQLELKPGLLANWTGATIKDTLMDGLSYVKDSAYVVIRYGSDEMYTGGNSWRAYRTDAQWNRNGTQWVGSSHRNLSTADFFNVSASGNDLTFTLTSNFKYLKDPKPQNVDAIYIRFAAKVDDTIWDLTKESDSHVFSNTATWGDMSSTTKTTTEYESNLVSKTGKYNDETYNAEYSIIINPDALMLGTEKTVTLVDDLTHDGNATDHTAELVRPSVKLYDYDPDAADHKGTEISSGVYSVDYQEELRKDRNHYILTVTVPNGHAYVLEYAYRNTGTDNYKLKNTVTLHGKTSTVDNVKMQYTSTSGETHSAGLTIHKVDSRNVTTPLANATFLLQWFDPSDGTYKDVQEVTTNNIGDFRLTFSDAEGSPGPNAANKIIRPYDTLYKLTEKDAPDGYRKDEDWALYFIWTTNESNKDAAYAKAVGDKEASIDLGSNEIKYYYGSAAITLQMKNESSRLSFVKQWYDKDNHVIDGKSDTLPVKITLELWRRPNKDSMTYAQKVTDINLEKSENWSGSYTIANDHYADWYYYVKEVNSGRNYKVDYIGNDVQHDGTIVITNTETEDSGYELPSTGGAGTTPFTAVGGTMMLAALVYGVRRKRRRKGGAAD